MQNTPLLLIINGPVGIGKTTTAFATAAWLRAKGIPSACLDLDEIYRMIRQQQGFGDQATWRQTRQAAAVMANHLLAEVVPVVIVEGGFYTPADLDDLSLPGPLKAKVVFVTLHASHAEVARRVAADPDTRRVASKDPVILAQLYREYEAALAYLSTAGLTLAVESRSASEVAARVGELALHAAAGTHEPM